MVPVMVMGTIIGGKFYSVFEYVCAGLIAVGISLFASKSSGKAVRKLANPNAPLGYFLCLANLVLDGYTNAAQACLLPPCLPLCFYPVSNMQADALVKIVRMGWPYSSPGCQGFWGQQMELGPSRRFQGSHPADGVGTCFLSPRDEVEAGT